MGYDFGGPEIDYLIPGRSDLFSGIDMGRKPTVKPASRFAAPTACARCGQLFAAVVRQGRPERFCSDPCRQSEAVAQRRDWQVNARADPEERPTRCQQCGAALAVKSATAGRFRRFCSRRCLKKSREPPRGPDLLDVARTDPENSTRQEAEGHETEENNR
nr:hypothetical protein [Brucella anthropi]